MLLEGRLDLDVVLYRDVVRRREEVLYMLGDLGDASHGLMVGLYLFPESLFVQAEEIVLFGHLLEKSVHFEESVFRLGVLIVLQGVQRAGIEAGIGDGEERLDARTLQAGRYGYGPGRGYGGAGSVARLRGHAPEMAAFRVVDGAFPVLEDAALFGQLFGSFH